jgi:hypothetical protein
MRSFVLAVVICVLAAALVQAKLPDYTSPRLADRYKSLKPSPPNYWVGNAPPYIDQNFIAYINVQGIPWARSDPRRHIEVEQNQGAKVSDYVNHRELFIFNASNFNVQVLRLFDPPSPLEYHYVNNPPNVNCDVRPMNSTWFSFEWVQYANFSGQIVVDGLMTDVWGLADEKRNFTAFLYTFSTAAVPIRQVFQDGFRRFTNTEDYYNYQPGVPSPNFFTIPGYCPTPKATTTVQKKVEETASA